MAIVGNDSDGSGKRLAKDFASRQLRERVNFLPAVKPEELPGLYSAADVFLMPSHHENFGNVAIEAAVCGCYVLASVGTAVAEQLEQLGAGNRLPRVTQAWTDALGLRKADCPLSIECVNRVKKSFSEEYVAEMMESFYNSLVC
jgi:glycosyltransferase involved in cell wall biosynthesis